MDATLNGVTGATTQGVRVVSVDGAAAERRTTPNGPIARNDRIVVSRAALSTARSDLGSVLGALDRALGAGRTASQTLAQALSEARAGALSPELEATLAGYDAAIAEGGTLLSGGAIEAVLDPRGAPVRIEGANLRRDGAVGEGASAVSGLQALQTKLDSALAALSEQGARFSAHGGLLELLNAELRSSLTPDLTAEEARLLALQVGQSLAAAPSEESAGTAILALFKD